MTRRFAADLARAGAEFAALAAFVIGIVIPLLAMIGG